MSPTRAFIILSSISGLSSFSQAFPGFHHSLKHFQAFIILSSISGLSSSSQVFPGFHHPLKHSQAFIILSSIPAEGRVTVSLRRSIIFFEFEIII
jgi:hypothetical protein